MTPQELSCLRCRIEMKRLDDELGHLYRAIKIFLVGFGVCVVVLAVWKVVA